MTNELYGLTTKGRFLDHADRLGVAEGIAQKLWSGMCWEILRDAKQQDSEATGGALAIFSEDDGGSVLPVRFTEEGE
mgnify:FL=1